MQKELNLNLDARQKHVIDFALRIGAIKLRPEEPFTWASRYRMPIYNDNRMLLKYPEIRTSVMEGLCMIIEDNTIQFDTIAGTATAGIPWGAFLAMKLNVPFAYIRDKPKDHGLKNRIEGLDVHEDFAGQKVLVIEDLISTGGSSAKAVEAVHEAKGNVEFCLSIFNYGFPEAQQLFTDLTPPCKVLSLITYPMLLDVAKKTNYLQPEQVEMLKDWSHSPFAWGAKNGFPRVEEVK